MAESVDMRDSAPSGADKIRGATISKAPLKDYFDADLVTSIGEKMQANFAAFNVSSFAKQTLINWDELTFTQRSERIASCLHAQLPAGEAGLAVLAKTLPDELQGTKDVLNDNYWLWPFGDYLKLYGHEVTLDAFLTACYELTKRFTAEFAIRPRLLTDQDAIIAQFKEWAHDKNPHVRRFVSEGTRPRLPWAKKLDIGVETSLELLGLLRADRSTYVRKSVANHLNDLAKEHDQVLDVLEEWFNEDNVDTKWIVRHAVRNHLKAGNKRVLDMLGYKKPAVDIKDIVLTPSKLAIGGSTTMAFSVRSKSQQPQKLMIDIIVGYMKANGERKPKVFKFKDFVLHPDENVSYDKKLSMQQRSTRKLYPGVHTIAVQVNGTTTAKATFQLQ